MDFATGGSEDLVFAKQDNRGNFTVIRDQKTLSTKEREEKAWLMGFLVGDGSVTYNSAGPNVACYPGFDYEVALYCQRLFEILYGVHLTVLKIPEGYKIKTQCRAVYEDLMSICSSWDTETWQVPFAWFQTDGERANFVSGWIDADGSQEYRGPPSAASVNEAGVQSIVDLLKLLGISCTKNKVVHTKDTILTKRNGGKSYLIQAKDRKDLHRLSIGKQEHIRKILLLAPFRSKHKLQRAQHYVNQNYLYLRKEERLKIEKTIDAGMPFEQIAQETGHKVEEIQWVDQSRGFMRSKNGAKQKQIEEILPKAEAMYAAGATMQEVIDALSPDGSDITQALRKRGVVPLHRVPYNRKGIARVFNYTEEQCFAVVQRELACFNISLDGIDYYSLDCESVKNVKKPLTWFKGINERTWYRFLLMPRVVRLTLQGLTNRQIASLLKAKSEHWTGGMLQNIRQLVDPEAITQRALRPADTKKKVVIKTLVGRAQSIKTEIDLRVCENPECPLPGRLYKPKYNRETKHCDTCAKPATTGQGWTKEKLFAKAKEVVEKNGRYTIGKDIAKELKISVGTLTNYGVRPSEVNRACGFTLLDRGDTK